MAGSSYEYTIALIDKISGPAVAAVQRLDKLTASLDKTANSLHDTTKAMSAAPDVSKTAAPLEKIQKSTTNAAHAMEVGKQTIDAAVAGIRQAFTSLASGDVVGAVHGVTDAVAGMAKALDLVMPGLGEAVSAVVSFAGGLASITLGLAAASVKFAIASTEAKNAALAQWSALGEGKISGAEVNEMLEDLRAKTGLAKDTLAPLTTQFLKMGITGKDALEGLTRAAAAAEATVAGGGEAFGVLYRQVNAAAEGGQKLTIPYKKLETSLEKIGLNTGDVARAMGKSTSELQAGLKAGTVDAKVFGAAMQDAIAKKGAGPMAVLANSAENIGKLFHEYLGNMFEDLGKSVEPFMGAIRDAVSVLDAKTSPLGAQLKATIGAAMSWIFATLTKLVPLAREFFWGLVVLALKAYIAIAPVVFRIKDFLTSATGLRALHAVWTALVTVFEVVAVAIGVVVAVFLAIEAVAVVVGVAIWNLISAFASAAASVVDFVAGVIESVADVEVKIVGVFLRIGARILGALQPIFDVVADLFGQVVTIIGTVLAPVVDVVAQIWAQVVAAFNAAVGEVGAALSAVWDEIASIFSPDKATAIADHLIDGLVGGIAAGATRVAGALKSVGQGAIDAVTGVLGIHSPSKVMAQLGGHTAEGFAQGVDAGTDRTQGALTSAVSPPTASPASAGGGGGGVTIDVGGLSITLGQGADEHAAEALAKLLPAAITRAFEEVAVQLGGAIGEGAGART